MFTFFFVQGGCPHESGTGIHITQTALGAPFSKKGMFLHGGIKLKLQ